MEITGDMLKLIQSRIEKKLLLNLPEEINFFPTVQACPEKKEIFCLLLSKGSIAAEIFLKKNKYFLLNLIIDSTYLSWHINYENDGDIVFVLKSGYVVFCDGYNDDNHTDIYAYYKIIDGYELDLDSFWSFEQSTPKELKSHELNNWEYDLECFDFERRRPDGE